jgi:hypothetical protein
MVPEPRSGDIIDTTINYYLNLIFLNAIILTNKIRLAFFHSRVLPNLCKSILYSTRLSGGENPDSVNYQF